MTTARSQQIDLQSTTFYHCMVRCVRRAYLCGEDNVTGQNYDHRRQWIVTRSQQLSSIFAIDICAYAVMSNHYHIVLNVKQQEASEWSLEEVVDRWSKLFNVHFLVESWLSGRERSKAVETKAIEIIEEWRERLTSISWFMRCLNEHIARQANAEDKCKGRFWEGRFKSQALLDEVALLTCMTYVDLNPIRANMAATPEESDFTSIQQRLYQYMSRGKSKTKSFKKLKTSIDRQLKVEKNVLQECKLKMPKAKLMKLSGSSSVELNTALPITREDYFNLVEQTGKIIREDKRGAISIDLKNIFNRFGIEESCWIDQVKNYHNYFTSCVGSAAHIRRFAEKRDLKWMKGVGSVNKLYCSNFA